MKNCVNIFANEQIFPYLVSYEKLEGTNDSTNAVLGKDVTYCVDEFNDTVRFIKDDINHYRYKNIWYRTDKLQNVTNTYIPDIVKTSNIKVYIPTHQLTTYFKKVRYALTVNTWINGVKIDLGSFIFNPIDTIAVPGGAIKRGNNEYYEYIDFEIIDPFYVTYSDDFIQFRNNVCHEPLGINNTGSTLYVSLFVVDADTEGYTVKDGIIGGCTTFNISGNNDYLALSISNSLEPHGIKFDLTVNGEYTWLLDYLYETYGIRVAHSDIMYELVLKTNASQSQGNVNGIIIGPTQSYTEPHNCAVGCRYAPTQVMSYDYIRSISAPTPSEQLNGAIDRTGIKNFFSSWDAFEEGWSFVGSMNVYDNEGVEILNLVSNELPVTQELFSTIVNGGAEKIIDIEDMQITTYNVVNKIENKIIKLERNGDSKDNIMQPVFFRAKDLEMLTLHPLVTETISINLDDYKSKVDKFVLLIGNCRFEQIGANKYGILFKIQANRLSNDIVSGTYYVLNENDELVSSGKYSCVR